MDISMYIFSQPRFTSLKRTISRAFSEQFSTQFRYYQIDTNSNRNTIFTNFSGVLSDTYTQVANKEEIRIKNFARLSFFFIFTVFFTFFLMYVCMSIYFSRSPLAPQFRAIYIRTYIVFFLFCVPDLDWIMMIS